MGIFGSKRKPFSQWQTVDEFDPVKHWQSPADAAPFAPQREAPQQQDDPGFWQGGGKFGVRDGIAGLLAIVGDTLSQRGGGQAGAVDMLAGGRSRAMEQFRKDAAEAQRRKQTMDALIAAGIDPAKANLGAMGVAKYGELAPKPEVAPERVRTAEWWQNATPEQRAAFDQTNPIVTQGYGSTMVPRATLPQAGGLPPQYDPNEWEVVPGGQGGAGVASAPRNFRRR